MKVQQIHKLVGIPETASDYYNEKTLPQCKIHLETQNFVVFLWNRGYYGAGGDCSYTRVYIVHLESQEWCELIELDQTWGDAWYKFDKIQDHGDYLEVKISGHCHGDYTATVDYDRDIFEAHLSGSGKLKVLRKKNPVVEKEKLIAAEEGLAKQRKWVKKEVTKALNETDVSDANLHAITEFRMNGIWHSFIKVVSPDLVICDGHRSLDSGSAGMGYFSQIRVWYKGQTDMKEWQWRDCYSASRDRHDLYINGVGEVEVQPKNGKVEIRVELLNREHGSRYTTFTFDDKYAETFPLLSEEKQAEFTRDFEAEIKRVLADLEERWTWKPYMLTSYGEKNYDQPIIKQSVLDAAHGVGAFVTKEQIDHHPGGDRQMRFELFILTAEDNKAKMVWEDHRYEKSEGARDISITSLTPNRLQIATINGQATINIS